MAGAGGCSAHQVSRSTRLPTPASAGRLDQQRQRRSVDGRRPHGIEYDSSSLAGQRILACHRVRAVRPAGGFDPRPRQTGTPTRLPTARRRECRHRSRLRSRALPVPALACRGYRRPSPGRRHRGRGRRPQDRIAGRGAGDHEPGACDRGFDALAGGMRHVPRDREHRCHRVGGRHGSTSEPPTRCPGAPAPRRRACRPDRPRESRRRRARP